MEEFIDRVYTFLVNKEYMRFSPKSEENYGLSKTIFDMVIKSEQFKYHQNLEFIQYLLCIIHYWNFSIPSSVNIHLTNSYRNFRKNMKFKRYSLTDANVSYNVIIFLKNYELYNRFKNVAPISSLVSMLVYSLNFKIINEKEQYYIKNMYELKSLLIDLNSKDAEILLCGNTWKIVLYKLLTFEFNIQQLQSLSKNEMIDIFFEDIKHGNDEMKELLEILAYLDHMAINTVKYPLLIDLKLLIDEHIQFINNHCAYRINGKEYVNTKGHFIEITNSN